MEPIEVAGLTTPIVSVDQRLPSLGTTSYFTAGTGFADEIESCHDSGAYAEDEQAVATAAGQFLGPWLARTCGDMSAANGFMLPGHFWPTSIIECTSEAIADARDPLPACASAASPAGRSSFLQRQQPNRSPDELRRTMEADEEHASTRDALLEQV